MTRFIETWILNTQEQFLQERIKVNGKAGNLGGGVVSIERSKSKITVNSEVPFSKRYLNVFLICVHVSGMSYMKYKSTSCLVLHYTHYIYCYKYFFPFSRRALNLCIDNMHIQLLIHLILVLEQIIQSWIIKSYIDYKVEITLPPHTHTHRHEKEYEFYFN